MPELFLILGEICPMSELLGKRKSPHESEVGWYWPLHRNLQCKLGKRKKIHLKK